MEEVWLGLLRIMLLVSRCAAEALLHTSPTVQHQQCLNGASVFIAFAYPRTLNRSSRV